MISVMMDSTLLVSKLYPHWRPRAPNLLISEKKCRLCTYILHPTPLPPVLFPLFLLLLRLIYNHPRHGLETKCIPTGIADKYQECTKLRSHTKSHHLLLIVRVTTVEGTNASAEAVRSGQASYRHEWLLRKLHVGSIEWQMTIGWLEMDMTAT